MAAAEEQCRYVTEWVVVKIRWSLKVDQAEKRALTRLAKGCANPKITGTRARIAKGTTGDGTGTGGVSGTDPQFFTTRADAKAAGYGPYVQGRDPNTTGTRRRQRRRRLRTSKAPPRACVGRVR